MSGKCGKTKTASGQGGKGAKTMKTMKGKGVTGTVDKKLDTFHKNADNAQAMLIGYAWIDIIK